jgi:RNA polymerase sigma factor (TIGR02999 family)
MSSDPSVTQLLRRWTEGDAGAAEALAPLVYDQLHALADRLFRGERPGHTLQPTALVHEAFVQLVGAEVDWRDRTHFYAIAARMMRRLLVNHAVARRAEKRGGDALRVTLDESSGGTVDMRPEDAELLDLEDALSALAALDPRKVELVELQYFAGLTFEEMAEVTGLSTSTLDRDLRVARAWLKDRLSR